MKTLVFFYTYRLGGWGDLVKGLHTCWCWAKATDRELKINFQHHIFGSLFPQYTSGFTNIGVNIDINAIDKVGSVTVDNVRALQEQNEITVLCNWFSPDSIGDVDPFPFYKELYSNIFPVPRIVQEQPYYVLHCRLGDKYLAEATACKGDDRIKSFGRIGTIIEQYKALGHPRTLVCSDNASIIKKLLATIPNSFTICPNPYHIAYPSQELHTKLEDILKIIQEHRAMTESAGIYMMSYSGFPITAGLIGSVDLQIWSEDCKLSAYSDSMVQGIKLLLNTNREQ
jgi:hypothetical protein